MRVSEGRVSVHFIEAKDYGSAGIDSDGVNLGKLNSLSAFLSFGNITGDSVLKCFAGATAAKTTAIAFKYRLAAADFKVALADQFGDAIDVASTGLTLTAATFDHRQIAIEIDSDQMPDGKPWLTIEISAVATTLNVAGIAIGSPRYPGHLIPTVI